MKQSNYIIRELNVARSCDWDNILSSYLDYNLYQTYGWGELKKKQNWNVIRLICYNDNRDVGLLQCLYKYYGLMRIAILWIPGGPVFLKENNDIQLQDLKCLIASLLGRFKKKLFYIRMYPMQHYDSNIILELRRRGFQRPISSINHGLTYHINTLLPEKQIHDNLTSNWRHNLKRSQKESLNFIRVDSPEEYHKFYDVYLKETKKNRVKIHYSEKDLATLGSNLSPFGSLNLFLSFSKGEILSGRLVCVVGRRAYDLLAVVTYEGRKRYATYALIWEIINWCKEKKIEYFDLSGIDPFRQEGIFNFKKGLGGKLTEYIGEWEFSNSFPLRLLVNLYISAFIKDYIS